MTCFSVLKCKCTCFLNCRRNTLVGAIKQAYCDLMRNNVPIYGVARDLKDFVTS